MTNSERCVSRQRAFLAPPGEARPDWWMVSQVAQRMGYGAAFDYRSAAEIFREHAQLTAYENNGTRALDLGAVGGSRRGAIRGAAAAALACARARSRSPPPFADGRFHTPSGKARMVAVSPQPPVHLPDADFPLALNTGRVRDHWHTLTRTARSARLSTHTPEPLLEVHPDDALRYGLRQGALARIASRWGEALGRIEISAAQRAGTVFFPMHWSGPYAARAAIGAVVNPVADPISGEPELKHTPVRVESYSVRWQAFVLSRTPLPDPKPSTGSRCADRRCGATSWPARRRSTAGRRTPARCSARENGWSSKTARQAGIAARACTTDDLESCVFVAPDGQLPPRTWLMELFTRERLDDADRMQLIGRAPRRRPQRRRRHRVRVLRRWSQHPAGGDPQPPNCRRRGDRRRAQGRHELRVVHTGAARAAADCPALGGVVSAQSRSLARRSYRSFPTQQPCHRARWSPGTDAWIFPGMAATEMPAGPAKSSKGLRTARPPRAWFCVAGATRRSTARWIRNCPTSASAMSAGWRLP